MHVKNIGTIIGPGALFDGELILNHDVRVEGTLKGKARIQGDLFLEKEGVLDAEVEVNSARIAGKVMGLLLAHEKIELEETALVTGDLQTKDLILNEGAQFKGNSTTLKEPKAS